MRHLLDVSLWTEGCEEQIELLQLDKSGIKVARYMTIYLRFAAKNSFKGCSVSTFKFQ